MRIVIVFEDCKIQNQLPEKKHYTLKMSAMVGVFENCGFSARHYIADNQFRKRDPRFSDYDRYKERHHIQTGKALSKRLIGMFSRAVP
jgi:hypothetical protein